MFQGNSLTDGLNQMSPEELEQFKIMMGKNFRDLLKPEPDDALPQVHHRFENEDDYMKRKLKNIQKCEEIRKQKAIDLYEHQQK